MTKSIGVIGIGIMGKGMALNLKKEAGYEVYAYNRTKSKLAPLVEVGIHACDTPMEVATKTTTLLTCVSDTPEIYWKLLKGLKASFRLSNPVHYLSTAAQSFLPPLSM